MSKINKYLLSKIKVVITIACIVYAITFHVGLAEATQSYMITAYPNPTSGGQTAGYGIYPVGTSITVEATPETGYKFKNWTENNSIVSTNPNYTFTIDKNRSFVANFEKIPENYTITTSSNPSEGGSVSGGGVYQEGKEVIVEATPNLGYQFKSWTENNVVVSQNTNYAFTANSNRNLVANFINTSVFYSISTHSNPYNGGDTSGGGEYLAGIILTVEAIPKSGYKFKNWTEDGFEVAKHQGYSFTVNSTRKLVANFEEIGTADYEVTTSSSPSCGGDTSGGGKYSMYTKITVEATPKPGYKFKNWTEDGSVVFSGPSYGFIVYSTRNLVANFEEIGTTSYEVTTSSSPSWGGTTSGGGLHPAHTDVTVSAMAYTGYKFDRWTVNGHPVSTSPRYTFSVTKTTNLVAHFVPSYTVTVSSNPINGGITEVTTDTNDGNYGAGQHVKIEATANPGYKFEGWTEDGAVISTSPNFSFNIYSDRNFVANFEEIGSVTNYRVTVGMKPPWGGTTQGDGTYLPGHELTVIAIPFQNYKFICWTEGGDPVSTNSNYTFVVNRNRDLVAFFEERSSLKVRINTSSSPSQGGTTSGGGLYDVWTDVKITAMANPGYEFVSWTEDGSELSTEPNITIVANSDRHLTANFKQIGGATSYSITTSSNPTEGGTTTGGGTYSAGSNVTVGATVNSGYKFKNWTENDSIVSSNQSYTFTVNSNRHLVANFEKAGSVNITGECQPANGGSIAGLGNYPFDEDNRAFVTISATPNPGFKFVKWQFGTGEESTISTLSGYTNKDTHVIAYFEKASTSSVNITGECQPANGGSIAGLGIYPLDEEGKAFVTISATPNSGFKFVKLQFSTGEESTISTLSGYVMQDTHVIAYFEKDGSGGPDPPPSGSGDVSFNPDNTGSYLRGWAKNNVTVTVSIPNYTPQKVDGRVIWTYKIENYVVVQPKGSISPEVPAVPATPPSFDEEGNMIDPGSPGSPYQAPVPANDVYGWVDGGTGTADYIYKQNWALSSEPIQVTGSVNAKVTNGGLVTIITESDNNKLEGNVVQSEWRPGSFEGTKPSLPASNSKTRYSWVSTPEPISPTNNTPPPNITYSGYSGIYKIDKTNPVINEFSPSSRPWSFTDDGLSRQPVNVYVSISDNLSGVQTFKYCWTNNSANLGWDYVNNMGLAQSQILTQTKNGVWWLHVWIADKAGNRTYRKGGPYKIDLGEPSVELPGVSPSHEWTNIPYTIGFKVSDPLINIGGEDSGSSGLVVSWELRDYSYTKDNGGVYTVIESGSERVIPWNSSSQQEIERTFKIGDNETIQRNFQGKQDGIYKLNVKYHDAAINPGGKKHEVTYGDYLFDATPPYSYQESYSGGEFLQPINGTKRTINGIQEVFDYVADIANQVNTTIGDNLSGLSSMSGQSNNYIWYAWSKNQTTLSEGTWTIINGLSTSGIYDRHFTQKRVGRDLVEYNMNVHSLNTYNSLVDSYAQLKEGLWYLHIKTKDRAGNVTSTIAQEGADIIPGARAGYFKQVPSQPVFVNKLNSLRVNDITDPLWGKYFTNANGTPTTLKQNGIRVPDMPLYSNKEGHSIKLGYRVYYKINAVGFNDAADTITAEVRYHALEKATNALYRNVDVYIPNKSGKYIKLENSEYANSAYTVKLKPTNSDGFNKPYEVGSEENFNNILYNKDGAKGLYSTYVTDIYLPPTAVFVTKGQELNPITKANMHDYKILVTFDITAQRNGTPIILDYSIKEDMWSTQNVWPNNLNNYGKNRPTGQDIIGKGNNHSEVFWYNAEQTLKDDTGIYRRW